MYTTPNRHNAVISKTLTVMSIVLIAWIPFFSLHAQKEIELHSDGLLLPRLDTFGVDSALTGLVFYDTLTARLMYYNGSNWRPVGGPFERNGNLVLQQGYYDSDDFLFGREALPENGEFVFDKLIFFDQEKSAFRGGKVGSSKWSPDSIGNNSFAFGEDNQASGEHAIAMGINSLAKGDKAPIAMGFTAYAEGEGATSIGYNNFAIGFKGATAFGSNTFANGDFGTTAVGFSTHANGTYGVTAMGDLNTATGNHGTTVFGTNSGATGDYGIVSMGYNSAAIANYGSIAMGSGSIVYGDYGSMAMGNASYTYGNNGAIALGYNVVANGNSCIAIGMFNDTVVTKENPISSTSPIFIIGNGDSGAGNESNALVVRKDGNVSIGAGNPNVRLEVGKNGDGTIARANAWDLYSDRRFKKHITKIDHPLETVLQLEGRNFEWKSSGKADMGFIAQEVEAILPILVNTDTDGYKSLDYDKLVPLLVEAIKDLHGEVEKLKAKQFND